jgi:hypothetical protein
MSDKKNIPKNGQKAVISSSNPKVGTGFGNKLNAVIYCRVSSAAQLKKGDGLASQETRCREHAKFRGYEIILNAPDKPESFKGTSLFIHQLIRRPMPTFGVDGVCRKNSNLGQNKLPNLGPPSMSCSSAPRVSSQTLVKYGNTDISPYVAQY